MIITSQQPPIKIFFEGDSITANDDHYLSNKVYNDAVVGIGAKACLFDYSVPSSTISDLVTRFADWGGSIRYGDIVHVWVGTNDIANLGNSAATVYADLCSYASLIRDKGGKVICATTIARGTDTGKETIRLAYNALIRGGSTFVFDAIADIGSDTVFDAIADTANTTYYQGDRIHLTATAWNLCSSSYIIPSINTVHTF